MDCLAHEVGEEVNFPGETITMLYACLIDKTYLCRDEKPYSTATIYFQQTLIHTNENQISGHNPFFHYHPKTTVTKVYYRILS